jgi:hypothetical protein
MQINFFMHRYINMGALVFIFFGGLTSCTTAQQVFYSYKVDSYFTGKLNKQFAASHVISCGDYLVEFNTKVNFADSGIAKDGEITILRSDVTYDTLSVYLLTPNGQYVEFDTFSLAGKLLKKGPIANKESGIKTGANPTETVSKKTTPQVSIVITDPKDTVINNVTCYYADIMRSKNTILDTVGIRYFMIKNAHFSSVYKMLGIKWKNNDYTIIGLQQYMYEDGEGYVEKIAELRPLNTTERKICESLITKAGLPLPK